ncbi:MAG: DUF87 domain-containing protein [Firmicutes bacterium]|nr:DUF87 domain-containing protein [Bacillota bacterium]
MQASYELLGQFYLGKRVDLDEGVREEGYYLYDSADLTTHAVSVGMTGSGKTGLSIDLLEEAAMDGIPTIIVDPKGDMANLLLNFPDLASASFRPWLSKEEARKEGVSPDDLAERTASTWKKGLADWDQDGDRMAALKNAVDRKLYTPGSNAGIPLSIASMGAFPGREILDNREVFLDSVQAAATDFLTLAGIEADPMTSRDHILLSTIIEKTWSQGKSLTIEDMVALVMDPPLDKVGVIPLETYYSKKDRMSLAMAMNNVLAAPSFGVWMEGEPLDIDKLLYTEDGRPRHSILSISHLSESSRMFFVTMVLHKLLAWVRRQPGTSSLRAIFYMDEIFGFLPPVANPPSKPPFLTLLKQARAYGLGLVLASQNPVDLDYKALSNIGTWFIGRLQTKQDKNRLLDGLEEGEGGLGGDRDRIDRILSDLPKRTFLVKNVHADGLDLIQSRWAMSYLAGPLSRPQLALLKEEEGEAELAGPASADPVPGTGLETRSAPVETPAPQVPSGEEDLQAHLPSLDGVDQYLVDGGEGVYIPVLYGLGETTYFDRSVKTEARRETIWSTPLMEGPIPVDWSTTAGITARPGDLRKDLPTGARLAPLPAGGVTGKAMKAWAKDLEDYIYRNDRFFLYENKKLSLVSDPEESLSDFQVRADMAFREERDRAVQALRASYEKKIRAAEAKVETARQRLEREEDQAAKARSNTMISVGSAILDGLLGKKIFGKTTANKAATAARAAGRQREQVSDIDRAQTGLTGREEDLALLEEEMSREIRALQEEWEAKGREVTDLALKPRKADIHLATFLLVWVPQDRVQIAKREDPDRQ